MAREALDADALSVAGEDRWRAGGEPVRDLARKEPRVLERFDLDRVGVRVAVLPPRCSEKGAAVAALDRGERDDPLKRAAGADRQERAGRVGLPRFGLAGGHCGGNATGGDRELLDDGRFGRLDRRPVSTPPGSRRFRENPRRGLRLVRCRRIVGGVNQVRARRCKRPPAWQRRG